VLPCTTFVDRFHKCTRCIKRKDPKVHKSHTQYI
jgi:hypothetical protein